jgi:hypothetical protein
MANDEHVALLKKGGDAWNEWRDENANTNPDFTEAVLSHARLGSHLLKANLTGANLSEANLSRANLNETNLRGAGLSEANLTQSDMAGADLWEASLFQTVFGNTTLAEVRGLELCRQIGPSIIDLQTLKNSGLFPHRVMFLRGIGLPDTLIDYLPSFLNEAIQHYSCFISYSSKDQTFAERLFDRLLALLSKRSHSALLLLHQLL